MPDHKSSVEVKLAFLKNHPIQPASLDIDDKLPFDPNKLYFQITNNNDKLIENGCLIVHITKRYFVLLV